MEDLAAHSLMAKLAHEMSKRNFDITRHRPKERMPDGVVRFGTLPLALRRLYVIRNSSREQYKALRIMQQSLLAALRRFYPKNSASASGLKALLKHADDPEFRDTLDRLEKVETEIAENRTYGLFLEAVFQYEVWQNFPESYETPFSVDKAWVVYNDPNRKPTLFQGQWSPPDDVDDSDD